MNCSFPIQQYPTSYRLWEEVQSLRSEDGTNNSTFLETAYEALYKDPWEPFYIAAAAGLPPYDQRFRQYGFNRVSQVSHCS